MIQLNTRKLIYPPGFCRVNFLFIFWLFISVLLLLFLLSILCTTDESTIAKKKYTETIYWCLLLMVFIVWFIFGFECHDFAYTHTLWNVFTCRWSCSFPILTSPFLFSIHYYNSSFFCAVRCYRKLCSLSSSVSLPR